LKNLPVELEFIAPEWWKHLSRITDFSKLKTRPNDKIDMNNFSCCVVGESYGFDEWYVKPKEHFLVTQNDTLTINHNCTDCVDFSYRINEEYHSLADTQGKTLPKFIDALKRYIKHFKDTHPDKLHINVTHNYIS